MPYNCMFKLKTVQYWQLLRTRMMTHSWMWIAWRA